MAAGEPPVKGTCVPLVQPIAEHKHEPSVARSFFNRLFFKFIYLFIYDCVGSSFLC